MAANTQRENNRPESRAPKSTAPPPRTPAVTDHFWFGALVLFVLTLAVYLPALRNAGFIWDDDGMLTNNEFVHARDGLYSFWCTTKPVDYFPVTMSTLWLEWRKFGMNPFGYHVVTVVLHALSTVVLWRVLRLLKIPGAFWAALIFAVHPVNVESAAWIAETKNTISMLFFAVAFWSYLKFDLAIATPGTAPARAWPLDGRLKWYAISLITFALALLSKQSVVMLPVVLLLCVWWLRNRITADDFLRTVPFFVLSAMAAYVAIWFQYNRSIGDIRIHEVDFATRLAGAGWNVWFYFYKALLPLNLIFVYPKWEIDSHAALSYLPGIAYLALLGVLWFFRKSWGRPFFFAFAFFVVMLFPILGFFKIFFFRYSLVADHYQYYSLIAIVALAVALVMKFFKREAPYILAALAVGCAVLTVQQCRIYQNQDSLWTDTLQKNSRCWMAHGNWAYYYQDMAMGADGAQQHNLAVPLFEKAIEKYRSALAIKPDDVGSIYNIGVCLLRLDRVEEAAAAFRQVIHFDPTHVDSLDALGWTLAISRNPALQNGVEAVRFSKRAVALAGDRGDFDMKLESLAAAYAAAGQFDSAVKTQTKAIETARRLGKAMPDTGDMEKRLKFYQSSRPYREGD